MSESRERFRMDVPAPIGIVGYLYVDIAGRGRLLSADDPFDLTVEQAKLLRDWLTQILPEDSHDEAR